MAMSLENLRRGKQMRPPRMVIYGEHKIGKSTFAASFPNTVFIATEEGLDHIDAQSFPLCTSYADVLACISELFSKPHDFSTVAIDSLDWLETLIFSQACKDSGKNYTSIEDFGYGKGYVEALKYWHEILGGLNALRDKRGMAVVCIAHHAIKRFDAPDTESYDQYRIKLHDKAGALVQEWADVIGFCAEETHTKKSEAGFNKEVVRAIGTGRRLLHLRGKPSFQAGNRYNLPPAVELNANAFFSAFNAANAPPAPAVTTEPAAAAA